MSLTAISFRHLAVDAINFDSAYLAKALCLLPDKEALMCRLSCTSEDAELIISFPSVFLSYMAIEEFHKNQSIPRSIFLQGDFFDSNERLLKQKEFISLYLSHIQEFKIICELVGLNASNSQLKKFTENTNILKWRDGRLIKSLFVDQVEKVKLENNRTDEIQTSKPMHLTIFQKGQVLKLIEQHKDNMSLSLLAIFISKKLNIGIAQLKQMSDIF